MGKKGIEESEVEPDHTSTGSFCWCYDPRSPVIIRAVEGRSDLYRTAVGGSDVSLRLFLAGLPMSDGGDGTSTGRGEGSASVLETEGKAGSIGLSGGTV